MHIQKSKQEKKENVSYNQLYEFIFQSIIQVLPERDISEFVVKLINNLLEVKIISAVDFYMKDNDEEEVLAAWGKKSNDYFSKIEVKNIKDLFINGKRCIRHASKYEKMPKLFPEIKIPIIINDKKSATVNIKLNQYPKVENICLQKVQTMKKILNLKFETLLNNLIIDDLNHKIISNQNSNDYLKNQISSLSKELYTITAISTILNPKIDLKEFIHKSLRKLNEIFKSSVIALFINDHKHYHVGLSEFYPKLNGSTEKKLSNVLHNKFFIDKHRLLKPTIITKNSSFWNRYYNYSETENYKMIICSPLQADKKNFGIIFLLYKTNINFTQNDLRLLSGISNVICTAIENKILHIKHKKKIYEEEFLYQSINRFHNQLNLEITLKSICEQCIKLYNKNTASYLFTNSEFPLVHACHDQNNKGYIINSQAYKSIDYPDLQIFYNELQNFQEAFILQDIFHPKISIPGLDFFKKYGHTSIIVAPLTENEGFFAYIVLATHNTQYPFGQSDLSLLIAMIHGASIAIKNIHSLHETLKDAALLEEKIQEMHEHLNKVHDSYHYRIDNRKDILFWIDVDYRIVFANKALEKITGNTKQVLYSQGKTLENYILKQEYRKLQYYFKKILEKEQSIATDLEVTFFAHSEDQHIINLVLLPLRDEQDNIIGVEGVGKDLTEEKRLEQEAKKNKELAVLGEFSSAMAHQLRNPLGNILMGTKHLQQVLDSTPDMNKKKSSLTSISYTISDIITETYNMNQIITELMEYTKHLNMRKTNQNIQVILEESISAFRDLIRSCAVEIERRFLDSNITVYADAVLLAQAIQNVIHNALQAMPGGGKLTVSLEHSPQKKNYVQLKIKDTGPGLTSSELNKIFRPFYTSKDQGTGLGLSFSHRIIQAHQGLIWASTNKPRGLTMNILLPGITKHYKFSKS